MNSTCCNESILEQVLQHLPQDQARAREVLSRVDNWHNLLDTAAMHSLDGLLLHIGAGEVAPAEAVLRLHTREQARRMYIFHLRSVLDEVLRLLGSMPVVLLKGISLAERLYGDPAIRGTNDIDLLISPDRLGEAIDRLQAAGYRFKEGEQIERMLKKHHHVTLYKGYPPSIELHFILHRGFGSPLSIGDYLSRASAHSTPAQNYYWLLHPEDELLHLCTHASAHFYLRLFWLYDLKLYLQRYTQIDWGRVAERARKQNVYSGLLITLYLLRRLGVRVEGLESEVERASSRAEVFLKLQRVYKRRSEIRWRYAYSAALLMDAMLYDRATLYAPRLLHGIGKLIRASFAGGVG